MNVIELRKKIVRGGVEQFNLDVSFVFDQEILVVFGPSGSGKSLTLQLIAGLLEPDEGRIILGDEVVFDADERGILKITPVNQRKIGFVFQQPTLFPHMTVAQNILYGVNGDNPRVVELIERLRLTGLESYYPAELSVGQQQRVAMARALASNPRLLLLDEPFSALDNRVREKLRQDLVKTQRELNIPTILVTHDLSEALVTADKMVILNNGRVEQIGSPLTIYHCPANRNVARFTGMKNIFEGKVVYANELEDKLVVASEGFAITMPYYPVKEGSWLSWGIRPENILILKEGKPVKANLKDNIFEVEIVGIDRRDQAFTLFVRATTKDYDFEILVPDHAFNSLKLSLGQHVRVALKKDAIRILEPLAIPRKIGVEISTKKSFTETLCERG